MGFKTCRSVFYESYSTLNDCSERKGCKRAPSLILSPPSRWVWTGVLNGEWLKWNALSDAMNWVSEKLLCAFSGCHNHVAYCNEMRCIFIFFCKEVGKIDFAGDMVDIDKVRLNRFSDRVFSDLYVTQTFCCEIVWPTNTCSIIIVDFSLWWHVFVSEI